MTTDEIAQVENMVNDVIAEGVVVEHTFMPYDDAIAQGALAFFKENYGEVVSVYRVPGFSMELCGGPHVENTGVLGKFRITKQERIGAGILRVKAVLEPSS